MNLRRYKSINPASKMKYPQLAPIADQVRLRRCFLHMSQRELGAQCGLHAGSVAELERGNLNISIMNLIKVLDVLDLSVSIGINLQNQHDG